MTVGVGIIGLGFGRIVHLPAFLALRDAKLIGVASQTKERVCSVTTEYALPIRFSTWRELIASPDIQAVSIATPPVYHEEMVLAALSAGKAVLCEKPLALNSFQAKVMVDAARKAETVHMVDFEFREIPAFMLAKQIIGSGELGAIRHVNVNWIVRSWADSNRPWSWQTDRAQGGGALSGWGVHCFDYTEWLLQPIRALSAHLSTRVCQRPDASGKVQPVTGEDVCHVLMELRDGTPVNLVVSSVAGHGKGHWIEVYGERKALVLGSSNLKNYGTGYGVWLGESRVSRLLRVPIPRAIQFQKNFTDGRVAPFLRLAERFITAVHANDRSVRPSFEEGYRAQVLMDMAVRASMERCWISVPAVKGEER